MHMQSLTHSTWSRAPWETENVEVRSRPLACRPSLRRVLGQQNWLRSVTKPTCASQGCPLTRGRMYDSLIVNKINRIQQLTVYQMNCYPNTGMQSQEAIFLPAGIIAIGKHSPVL